MKTKTKKTIYETVTEKFISLMEQEIVPWRQPWSEKSLNLLDHQNLISGHQYKGINAMITLGESIAKKYDKPYWLTFKQALELGANVKKGEKGLPIVYWLKCSSVKDKDGSKKSNNSNNDPEFKSFMVPRIYTIFNVDQVENLDIDKKLLQKKKKLEDLENSFTPIEACEEIMLKYYACPEIRFIEQRAYYKPFSDYINMPKKESFKTPEHFYATLFHEATHSTGHKSRLNRDSLTKVASFGSHEYSKEELVAELGSAFLCCHAGINSPEITEGSASYLKSWIRVLKGDSKLLFQASSQAQKSTEFILGIKKSKKESENEE